MTECSLGGVPLPWWFQVEAFGTKAGSGEEDSTSTTDTESSAPGGKCAGKFRVVRRKHEMSLCEGDSVSGSVAKLVQSGFPNYCANWLVAMTLWRNLISSVLKEWYSSGWSMVPEIGPTPEFVLLN